MGGTAISVRGLAAIFAVCVFGCVAGASASAAQLAVVGQEESHSVSIVDTATNEVVGEPIDVDGGPASIAIGPDGRYAYVAGVTGNTVSVVEIATGRALAPIEVGNAPFGLAVTPAGDRVFVTDSGGDEVSIIDTRQGRVVGAIPLAFGTNPQGVAITPDGRFAYVTESPVASPSGVVEVFDTETLEAVGAPIEVGEGPVGVEFTPDGKTAYVADQGSDEVSAIDTATREVTPIELGGERPRGVVVAPDGKKAFVVELGSNSVAVVDTAADEVSDEIPVGATPQEVAIAADGKVVYVTVVGGSPGGRTAEVERIDVEAGAVIGTPIELPGEFGAGIALTPDQSPTAAFAVPDVTAGVPATFSGAASTDPDGSVASWDWAFGDGGTASGMRPLHTYRAPGATTRS